MRVVRIKQDNRLKEKHCNCSERKRIKGKREARHLEFERYCMPELERIDWRIERERLE